MATSYDSINSITYDRLCDEKIWKIKARIIWLWKVLFKFDKSKTTYIKMVLMDDNSYLVKMFENELIEGRVYVFSNFVIEVSSEIYLPTAHVCRITFKMESRIVNTVDDRKISNNHFNFLAHADILKQINE
ncbi:hypothetical protein AHAS_Ahas12G0159800 [Arachis hypogaea]